MPNYTCPSAAEAAFSLPVDWVGKRASLEALNGDAINIVKFAGDTANGLSGLVTLYMQMDPLRVPGLKDLQMRYQTANRKLIEKSADRNISRLGIAGQIAPCFGETNLTILANSWGASFDDLAAAKEKAREIAYEKITVAILVLPRKDRTGEINSIHFVVLYWPIGDPSSPCVIVSYNYQKGEGFSSHYSDVAALWSKAGIYNTSPPDLRNSFERLWESAPPNAALAIRDITQYAVFPDDKKLIDAVFPTSVGAPGMPVYDATWAIELDIDAKAVNVELETTHQLAAILKARGTVASGGPHVGSFNCLYAGCAPLELLGVTLLGRPIDEAFATLARKATRGYKATGEKLWVTDYVERKSENFEAISPSDVLASVNQAFSSANLSKSRGEGRAAYASQYINFLAPHSDTDFMACAKIIAEAAVKALEGYADKPYNHKWQEIFGI